ncbi:uncharacterized protein ATNIH1004_004390 [Aspergillus tanneri]|uniref:Uncharacterized protein n=1 Tax=Aspergillus tanneri TaxID=1220188 RepID=A0A5M9MNA4_9EURO|nr:uncharacterized protein ATNIH1004_004390 [Aspergillus tanneri]KAA8648505.1 hypothetical protein ATNIH1004_004390 [Aspergillus tanneri]
MPLSLWARRTRKQKSTERLLGQDINTAWHRLTTFEERTGNRTSIAVNPIIMMKPSLSRTRFSQLISRKWASEEDEELPDKGLRKRQPVPGLATVNSELQIPSR